MIAENDFVLIDFVGRIMSSGKIFDLTKKDVADKEGINNKEFNFLPVLVIPGSGYVLKAVADSLLKREVGDKYTLEIKSENAFGKFDPKLVKTLSLNMFRQDGINPSVGDVLMLDNALVTILSVSGGRVMVSFNNPLAGKDLVYDIEIVKILDNSIDKCASIFEHYVGKRPDSLDINENKVKISYKGEIKPYTKDAISSDIKKYIGKDLETEVYST